MNTVQVEATWKEQTFVPQICKEPFDVWTGKSVQRFKAKCSIFRDTWPTNLGVEI